VYVGGGATYLLRTESPGVVSWVWWVVLGVTLTMAVYFRGESVEELQALLGGEN
jgi:hypothetical protein